MFIVDPGQRTGEESIGRVGWSSNPLRLPIRPDPQRSLERTLRVSKSNSLAFLGIQMLKNKLFVTQRCPSLIMVMFGAPIHHCVMHMHHTSKLHHASTTNPTQPSKTKLHSQNSALGTRHRHGHESHCVLNRARQLTSRRKDPYISEKFRPSCARWSAGAPGKPRLRRSTGL